MYGEKVSYKLFRQKLIEGNNIYENNFYIEDSDKYDDCWIGLSENGKCKLYWFGLNLGEENDYEYRTADEILNAKVFDGKSMHESCNFTRQMFLPRVQYRQFLFFKLCEYSRLT